jgi:hypothetical protein
MEPFLITIGEHSINPHHISSATITDDGTVRVWMIGIAPSEPIVFTGNEGKEMWQQINALSRVVSFPPRPRTANS